jgi:hypothetical protein
MHTWGASEGRGRINLSRIVTVATLLISAVALILALKKPNPVAPPQAPAAIAANAQSFQAKVDQLQQAQAQGQTGSEVHLTSNEIGAALAEAAGAVPASPTPAAAPHSGDSASPSAELAAGSMDQANLQEPIVSFEGNLVRGQFVSEVAGKEVYITVAGHLGSKDGYATFEPTEFKVGDLNVPVSLVNGALQKKMLEQRDRLKLPDFISDVRVENGELVIKQK